MLPRYRPQPIFAPARRDPCDTCCSCLRCRLRPRRTVLALWLVAAAVYLLIVLLPSPAATPAEAVPFFADDDGEADDQVSLRERARPRRARKGACITLKRLRSSQQETERAVGVQPWLCPPEG
jgi:hypothetical protein